MSDELEQKILRDTLFLIGRADGIQDELVQELNEVFASFKRRLELQNLTAFSRRRIERIAAELEGTLQVIYSGWAEKLSEETIKSAEVVVDRENKTFVSEFKVEQDDLYQLPLSRIETIVNKPIAGHTLETWAKGFTAKQSKAIKRSLIGSITEGLGVEAAAKKLRDDGALGFNRSQSKTLARTIMMQSASDARDETFEGYKQYIKAWRYVATLDSRTCLICAPWDGRVEKERKGLPSLVRHPNCRCQVVPWNEDLVDEDEKRAQTQHTERKVKHRDGSTSTKFKVTNVDFVSVKKTFPEFFKGMTEKQKLNYLGRTRFDLWKSGKVKFDEFQTPTKIKTIKQLEQAIDS